MVRTNRPIPGLLLGEHVLDRCAHGRLLRIRPGGAIRHRPARRLLPASGRHSTIRQELMWVNAAAWMRSLDGGRSSKEGLAMTTLKVIEVLAQSDKSWEDAAQNAINDAAKSVRGIKSIYIKELEGVVENNKVTQYRINAKVSFMVEGSQ
jgi:dodecin